MTTILLKSTAQNFRATLAELIDYDRKYKWLECGMCHAMTPKERYVIGDQACISCANKNDKEYGMFKDSYEKNAEKMVMDTLRQGDNYTEAL